MIQCENTISDASAPVGKISDAAIEALGFVKWEPGDEHDYRSGWHPGQTDDPHQILTGILDRHGRAEVLFFIDSAGQFDPRFSAYAPIHTDVAHQSVD